MQMYDRIKLVVNDESSRALIVMFADAFERLSEKEKPGAMSVRQELGK